MYYPPVYLQCFFEYFFFPSGTRAISINSIVTQIG